MFTIYLVRHGNYVNPENIIPGRLPVRLSLEGVEQIERLRRFFKDKEIHHIFSSPVLRCKETAQLISDDQIPIEYDLRLCETLSVGQGKPLSNTFRKDFYGDVSTLGGETQLDVQNRMVDFLMDTKFDQDNNYIICSHGDPLFFLYQYLKHQPLFTELGSIKPKHWQEKGSVRKLVLGPDRNVVEEDLFQQDTLPV